MYLFKKHINKQCMEKVIKKKILKYWPWFISFSSSSIGLICVLGQYSRSACSRSPPRFTVNTVRQNFNHTKNHGQYNNVHLIHSWKFPMSLSRPVPKANYLWALKSACHNLRAACYNFSGKADFRIPAVGSLLCLNILYIRLKLLFPFCILKV